MKIQIAQTKKELNTVYRIVHDAYLSKGYIKAQPDGKFVHSPNIDNNSNTTVFIAKEGQKTIGTCSCTLNQGNNTYIESSFKKECKAIRDEGKKVCEIWRVATRDNNVKAVVSLFATIATYAIENDVDTCVIEVNPCHERIYNRLLGFTTVTRKEETNGLKNAPAVMMRLDKQDMRQAFVKSYMKISLSRMSK